MLSPHLAHGGQMKILNAGTADFIVKDKRGNFVTLEPSKMVDVTEQTAKRMRVYPFIKIIEDVKVEVKPEVEVKEPKKKSRKRKNGIPNND